MNRAWTRRLFTFLYPRTCPRKRAAAPVQDISALTAALAVLAFFGGWTAGQIRISHWILPLLSVAMACWVVLLRRAAVLPFSTAAAILLMQVCALTIWISDPPSAGWLMRLATISHGLALVNLSYWAWLSLRSMRRRGGMQLLVKAVFLGMVVARCRREIEPLLGCLQHGPGEFVGIATGILLLFFIESRRAEMPHGLFSPSYLTSF